MTLQKILLVASILLFIAAAGTAFAWWHPADALGLACFGFVCLAGSFLPEK